jgi:hypothetical protein
MIASGFSHRVSTQFNWDGFHITNFSKFSSDC